MDSDRAIKVLVKTTFKKSIDSKMHLSIIDRGINNLVDDCLGTMVGNLYTRKLMFNIYPMIVYNLANQDFNKVLTLHRNFKKKINFMKEENISYSNTYKIVYALSNTHHSDLFLRNEYTEIPKICNEFAKVMTPNPINIPRIGGVDILMKNHSILDCSLNTRVEYGSKISFSKGRIVSYQIKRKELVKTLTPQTIKIDKVKIRRLEGWKLIQVVLDITEKGNYFSCNDLYHM